jgi:hypothetical protein
MFFDMDHDGLPDIHDSCIDLDHDGINDGHAY